jgi:hypothetical protein
MLLEINELGVRSCNERWGVRIRFAPLNPNSVDYFNVTDVATVRIGKITDTILYRQVVCVMAGREQTDRQTEHLQLSVYIVSHFTHIHVNK